MIRFYAHFGLKTTVNVGCINSSEKHFMQMQGIYIMQLMKVKMNHQHASNAVIAPMGIILAQAFITVCDTK